MHASTTGMETTRTVLLVVGLLCLTCLASGLSETEADQSGTFSVEDYSDWLENHTINVINYVAEVGTDVAILSPITPPPNGMRWFSLNFDGELRRPVGREVGRVGSTNSEKFLETYNTPWQRVFKFDKQNRWLRIRKVQLGYADLFRVFVGENGTGKTAGRGSGEGQTFDLSITLITFEKHECRFTSKPQNPKAGDTLILSCSVIVNGMWNASMIFRNDYDESEIIGETKTCGIQRSLGSKICSSVRVKAETDILAYSCRLEFPSDGRHVPKDLMFRNSKWTTAFNKKVVCNLPKIYLEAIPSDVTVLCNNMPCRVTVVVNDTVTCVAHGYPQPVFDLRIRDVSEETRNKSESQGVDYENRFFMDTNEEEERDDGFGGDYTKDTSEVEIKGHEDFRIGPKNVGHIEITCNVSNALGWGYNSLVLEVKLQHEDVEAAAAGGKINETAPFGNWQVSATDTFPEHNMKLLCNSQPCSGVVNVGDSLDLIYYGNNIKPDVTYKLKINSILQEEFMSNFSPYVWSLKDVGHPRIDIETTTRWGTENWLQIFTAVAASFGDLEILCNGYPCLTDGVMKVGDNISLYVDPRHYSNKDFFFSNVLPLGGCSDCSSKSYTLKEEDIGIKPIVVRLKEDGFTRYLDSRSISVIPGFGDVEIMCFSFPCLENGIMKVGDKIYLHVNFDIFVLGEGVQWRVNLPSNVKYIGNWNYTLRSEDVGRMTIEFSVNDSEVHREITRNIIVISDPLVGIDMLCNGNICRDHEIMRFGDEITCYFEPKVMIDGMNFTLLIDNHVKVEGYPCTYALREEDVGTKLVQCISQGKDGKYTETRRKAGTYQKARNISIVCEFRDGVVLKPAKKRVIIRCDEVPCDKPGRTIYTGTYVSCRTNGGQRTALKFIINGKLISWKIPAVLSEIYYKLRDADIGSAKAICSGNGTSDVLVNFTVVKWPCADLPASANLFGQPIGIDVMCNDKVCQDNEVMRFGDKISCNFEPKFMIDGLTFTLLLDNYTKVEGYPCTYVLREEDVGSKLVKCDSQDTAQLFENTRNITVICEFRDEVVLKPAKKTYDIESYEIKFRKDNATSYSGVIILCEDEPCDKPGRTIYNGTYVICRLNYGQLTNLKLWIDGNLVSWQRPLTVSETSYKLKRTGKTQASCYGTSYALNSTKTVSFRVYKWPCSNRSANVKPASADIFEYENFADENVIQGSMESSEHGDAAGAIDVDQAENIEQEHGDATGAIDVDQAENIDPGPAASNRDAQKWNDGTAENDKSKPSIGSGRESFVLLQLFLAFIAAFVGLGQF